MADLEKVIQALEECTKYEYHCDKCPYKPTDDETDCSMELTRDALELLKEQKWYSVNEKLPDEYAMYFVYTEKGHIYKVEFRPDEDYKEEPYYQWGYVESDCKETLDVLSEQPQIVRCKDCKFADQYIEPDKYGRYGLCEIHNRIIPRQDFFCADGERKG